MSSNRVSTDFLADIVDAISDLDDFTAGMTFEEFCADKKTINMIYPLSNRQFLLF